MWKLKTFGRVMPSKADRHYRKNVLRTVFVEWKSLWWEARVEWKFLVRAQYHHRCESSPTFTVTVKCVLDVKFISCIIGAKILKIILENSHNYS